jgi:hypothetical protein
LSASQALFQAIFANEEASKDDNDGEDKDSPRLVDCKVDDDNNNLNGFLSMVGSLDCELIGAHFSFLFCKIQSSFLVSLLSHVFGCPVYVLDASLQDGKKIPKWNHWACLGLFLGFTDLHSSLMPLVLNIDTGHISPQFHVIFDNKFKTVTSLAIGEPLDKNGLVSFGWSVNASLMSIMMSMTNQSFNHCQT